ncbi:MAG: archaeal heat shock protein Hsp14 [Nitrososphaeria archaeon]
MIKEAVRDIVKKISEKSRDVFEAIMPPVDIYEDGGNLIVVADVAGFSKEDIKVTLNEDILTISAERKEKEGVEYLWKQRPLKIKKLIPLPEKVENEKEISAKYENGVLTISLPLKKKVHIPVQ